MTNSTVLENGKKFSKGIYKLSFVTPLGKFNVFMNLSKEDAELYTVSDMRNDARIFLSDDANIKPIGQIGLISDDIKKVKRLPEESFKMKNSNAHVEKIS